MGLYCAGQIKFHRSKSRSNDANPAKIINLTHTIKMPMVGFGADFIQDEDAQSLVHQTIRSGYRHGDTAEAYGHEIMKYKHP